MAVSVRQLAENDALDIYDPEALRKETESLWLTGIAVLDENGESLCEYTDGNIDYAQFAESLREQAALNVLQNPQKTYLKRILLQDGTAVDVATRRAAAGDAVRHCARRTRCRAPSAGRAPRPPASGSSVRCLRPRPCRSA